MNTRAQILVVLLAVSLLPGLSLAGGTRIWEMAGYPELSLGEPKGTGVTSLGEVNLGLLGKKIDLSSVGLVWSSAEDSKGKIYLGTGYDGKIFRVDGNKTVLVAATEQIVITAMEFDKAGNLYAAALPSPVVWKIANPGKARSKKPLKATKWATLPKGTKHIWDLEWSADKRTLYAATGPEGKVFAIGLDGKPHVFADTDEAHVLSLAVDHKKNLLAGTSPGALLLSISGPGRYRAIADFEGTEVKAIASFKNTLGVAVNKFARPTLIPSKSSKVKKTTPNGAAKTNAPKRKGSGTLYFVQKGVRVEKLWNDKDKHIVSLAFDQGGTLYAGLGVDGTVIAVDDKHVLTTVLDVDERQVMSLIAGKKLKFAGTGDAGAAYNIGRAKPSDAKYLSPLLDAKAVSAWGRLHWQANGALRVRSRSGNSTSPDNTWSNWSKPIGQGQDLAAPPARHLQLEFSFGNETTSLLSAEVSYRPYNLRAMITWFEAKNPYPKKTASQKAKSRLSTRTASVDKLGKDSPTLALNWKVDNPDGDTMRYRLWYRAIGEKLWRPITKADEVLSKLSYKWNTESVPEGLYVLRLVAEDTLSNGQKNALSHEAVSVPILVDNHTPQVIDLSYNNGTVKGRAKDSFSALSSFEYSVDGSHWLPLTCIDGIFDEREETFEFKIPKNLSEGPHAIAVRAADRAGNIGSKEIHFQTP